MSKQTPRDVIKQVAQETIAQKGQPQTFPLSLPAQLTVTHQVTQQVSPFPAPEVLKLYNDAVPNGGERIVKMAESEQRHVHKMQWMAIGATFVGELFAFLVITIALLGSFWLVYEGKNVAAGAAFVTAVGIMVAGYYERRKYLAKQAEQQQQLQNQAQQQPHQNPVPQNNPRPSK